METLELPPAAEWSPDCPGWCFLRVSAHCGYWLGDGRAVEINGGEVLALSPLRTGCFRASQLGKVTLHHFRFSPDLAVGLLTPLEHKWLDGLAVTPGFAARHFPATAAGAVLWRDLLEELAPSPSTTLRNRIELLRIVANLLFAELPLDNPPIPIFQSGRIKLRLLLSQMPEEELLRMTPRDLAARCGISLVQINRLFRQILGESIRGQQELIRLRRARQMLAETKRPLEGIAIEAGFHDARSFAAAFKRRFAIAPAEWRNSA